MGVFGPVIEALVLPMLDPGHDLPLGSGVASQLVGDKHTRGSTLLLEELAEQAFGGLLVAPALDENIENEAAASTSRLLRARARGSVAGGNRRRQPGPEMEVSSHWTRRWREVDSNHRSLGKENCISAPFRAILNSDKPQVSQKTLLKSC
jgi:hypothetical protein